MSVINMSLARIRAKKITACHLDADLIVRFSKQLTY